MRVAGLVRQRRHAAKVLASARLVAIAVATVAAYFLVPLNETLGPGDWAVLAVALLAVVALCIWQARAITRSAFPRLRAVEALATVVPLFLIVFATAYFVLGRADPHAFTEVMSRVDALYFTVTTFATVGFGDITPRSESARVVAVIQMLGGILVIAGAVRLFLSSVRTGLKRHGAADTDD